jgi:hypothetical protein
VHVLSVIVQVRFSPGKIRPTAFASLRRLSPFSRDGTSLHEAPYLAILSSKARRALGVTAVYEVCRTAGTRYSLTLSDKTSDVSYEGYDQEGEISKR